MPRWTDAEYATLKAAVASGVLQVRYDGPPARSVTYQSLTEMRSLLAEMERERASASNVPTIRYAVTRKGR